MLKRIVFTGAAIAALVCLPAQGASPASELTTLWEAGSRALEENSPEEAARLFREWIDAAARSGTHSPEGHYNLALAYWASRKPGGTVHQLLESARLRFSPWSNFRTVRQLRSIEREIGVRDGLSTSGSFLAYFVFNRDWCVVLFSIGFWLLVTAAYLRWRGTAVGSRPVTACAALAILVLAFSAGGMLNRHYFGKLAVIEGESESIPLFKEPGGKDDTKVVDLPPGTLVTVGGTAGGYTQVVRPVLGWVPDRALLTLSPN